MFDTQTNQALILVRVLKNASTVTVSLPFYWIYQALLLMGCFYSISAGTLMLFLWLITLLWAFSFSFIGVYLAGQVDSYFSVFTTSSHAFLVLLSFLVRFRTSPKIALHM